MWTHLKSLPEIFNTCAGQGKKVYADEIFTVTCESIIITYYYLLYYFCCSKQSHPRIEIPQCLRLQTVTEKHSALTVNSAYSKISGKKKNSG